MLTIELKMLLLFVNICFVLESQAGNSTRSFVRSQCRLSSDLKCIVQPQNCYEWMTLSNLNRIVVVVLVPDFRVLIFLFFAIISTRSWDSFEAHLFPLRVIKFKFTLLIEETVFSFFYYQPSRRNVVISKDLKSQGLHWLLLIKIDL